jgi:dTMP kinase
MTAPGVFIAFEGGEGTGKSTQVRLLAERLERRGKTVVTTREPGGTPGAEQIRALLVTGDGDRWSPLVETLLLNAARADHIERLITPALARGDWVVSDRYAGSTVVYQGIVKGVRPEVIGELHAAATGSLWPDLTLVLDLPAAVGLARAKERTAERADTEGRFESLGLAFHERIRQGFLAYADSLGTMAAVVDADQTIDSVAAAVWQALSERGLV